MERLKQTGITLQVFKALGCIKYDLQKRRFSWITDFYVRRSALRRDIIFEDPGSTKFHLPGLKIILANFGKVLRPFEEKNKQAGQKNFFAFGDLNLPAMDVNKRAYMKTINNLTYRVTLFIIYLGYKNDARYFYTYAKVAKQVRATFLRHPRYSAKWQKQNLIFIVKLLCRLNIFKEHLNSDPRSRSSIDYSLPKFPQQNNEIKFKPPAMIEAFHKDLFVNERFISNIITIVVVVVAAGGSPAVSYPVLDPSLAVFEQEQ